MTSPGEKWTNPGPLPVLIIRPEDLVDPPVEGGIKRHKRAKRLLQALGWSVLTLGGCGILLLSATPTHTAGATISGHLQKAEKQMDGLVIVDEPAERDQP